MGGMMAGYGCGSKVQRAELGYTVEGEAIHEGKCFGKTFWVDGKCRGNGPRRKLWDDAIAAKMGLGVADVSGRAWDTLVCGMRC